MCIEEAPLNHGLKQIPHGLLDVLVVSNPTKPTYIGVPIVDGADQDVVFTALMKTKSSLAKRGSGMSYFTAVATICPTTKAQHNNALLEIHVCASVFSVYLKL